MPNPWMSLWLSAANSWASAVRGFWTAELRRQQTAMANQMVRQMTDFWVSVAGADLRPQAEASPLTGSGVAPPRKAVQGEKAGPGPVGINRGPEVAWSLYDRERSIAQTVPARSRQHARQDRDG
jgi:hypothetical protein